MAHLHVRRILIETTGMLMHNVDPFNRIQRNETHAAPLPNVASVKCTPSWNLAVTDWRRIVRATAVEPAQSVHGPFGPAFLASCPIAIQAISYYTRVSRGSSLHPAGRDQRSVAARLRAIQGVTKK